MSARLLVVAAAAAAAALVGAYVALGGGDYEVPAAADPCAERPFRQPRDNEELGERLVLAAVDGAACELRVSREEIVLAFASERERERFARRNGLDNEQVERALRAGLVRAIDDAERADVLGGTTAALLRIAARTLPLQAVLDQIQGG